MQDLEHLKRVRAVTANYSYLQGLRLVPMGLVLIWLAALGADWLPGLAPGDPLPAFLSLGLAVLGVWLIGFYYMRTFGRVQIARAACRRDLVFCLAWTGGLVVSSLVDARLQPPVSTFGLTSAGLLVGWWWISGCFRSHYLFGAAVVAAISCLPLLGLLPASPFTVSSEALLNPLLGLWGLVYIIGGLFDHWLLVRTLTPPVEPVEQAHGRAV